MSALLIEGSTVVNDGRSFVGSVLIKDERIEAVFESENHPVADGNIERLDARGLILIPGAIDDQVHFREPGLTHKGEIATESRAAVAGGVTSFMEMPNTQPQTVTQNELQKKFERAADVSPANFSFFMGATNDNLDEVLSTDPAHVCGIKVFMGSSTGNMLVDNRETLDTLFSRSKMLIATHCEDETTIRLNSEKFREQYGNNVPWKAHPLIRSAQACFDSSSMALELAKKHDTRLHILHISTARECALFDNTLPLAEKRITAEACIHHLWFSDRDYDRLGARIKWNPAIKSEHDRDAVWQALLDDRIDIVATDHAPHTLAEKSGNYWATPSGGPLVQHSVVAMMEMVRLGKITLERAIEKMAHAPAQCFRVRHRGFIRPGYFADLVLIDPNHGLTVTPENLLYKCGWSPFEGYTFSHSIHTTWVNGRVAWSLGKLHNIKGVALEFEA